MRILVTNDDGINAPGLKVAEAIARSLSDDVWVVAPALEQSGASHSLTLLGPVRLRKIDARHFSLTGTPTDCVMMAVTHLMKDTPPDLVISGVNRGVNVADDVTYSGTVAAAMEGTALGIPSVALSQGYPFQDSHQMQWACAETHAPAVLRRLLAVGWPAGVLINVNFPDCVPDQVAGIEATVQGKRELQEVMVDERQDLRGYPYFWIGFKRGPHSSEPGSDLHALMDRKISVTPLQLNLTEAHTLAALKRAFGG
jgi:5'-nucleotidase